MDAGTYGAFKALAELAANIEELLPAQVPHCCCVQATQIVEGLRDGIASARDHGGGVAVSAARRFL